MIFQVNIACSITSLFNAWDFLSHFFFKRSFYFTSIIFRTASNGNLSRFALWRKSCPKLSWHVFLKLSEKSFNRTCLDFRYIPWYSLTCSIFKSIHEKQCMSIFTVDGVFFCKSLKKTYVGTWTNTFFDYLMCSFTKILWSLAKNVSYFKLFTKFRYIFLKVWYSK